VPDDDLILWSKHVAQYVYIKYIRYILTSIVFIEDIPTLLVVSTVII
jgi:hypothetical protein